MNRSPVAALDHEPIISAVPGLAVWIFRERNGGRDVRPGAVLMVADLRQLVEIDLLAGENYILDRGIRGTLARERVLHAAQIRALHSLRLGMDHCGLARPSA